MNVSLIPSGGFAANCYVISADGAAAVVDPGEESRALCRFAEATALNIEYILLTHGHFDHIGAVAYLKERFPNARVCIGAEDAAMLESCEASLGARFGIEHPTAKADMLLADGDILPLGGEEIRVMHTPGHTRGGVTYLFGGSALCGDTLFDKSIGRWDFPGSCFEQLQSSLERLKALPAATVLYPGHGGITTLAEQLENNPYLR